MSECRCPACREHEGELSIALRASLLAWADESPPADLRARVLARALGAVHQAPAPKAAPHALPLFALVPVMAVLVAAIRLVAMWGPAWRYWPRLLGPAVLDVVGPTGIAAVLMLVLGGLAALALAPALFLESQGPTRRRRRALGLHG